MFEWRVGVEYLNGGLEWGVFTSLSEVSMHFQSDTFALSTLESG